MMAAQPQAMSVSSVPPFAQQNIPSKGPMNQQQQPISSNAGFGQMNMFNMNQAQVPMSSVSSMGQQTSPSQKSGFGGNVANDPFGGLLSMQNPPAAPQSNAASIMPPNNNLLDIFSAPNLSTNTAKSGAMSSLPTIQKECKTECNS
jgi:hypothetical protein